MTARLDRVVERIQDSGVDRAICFGHGHALRAFTLRWLKFDVSLGVHFPLDTGTVSILGLGEAPAGPGALELPPLTDRHDRHKGAAGRKDRVRHSGRKGRQQGEHHQG